MKTKSGKTVPAKEKKESRQPHPFGEPSERAKGFSFPSKNPTLHVYAAKTAEKLPQNLQDVVAAIAKHVNGVPLADLKVAKFSTKTLNWLVRQLCKHEYVRVKADLKAEKAPKAKPKATATGATKESA